MGFGYTCAGYSGRYTKGGNVENALIALAGIIAGVFVNEYFRAKNQIRFYSKKVFEKHLALHEELFYQYRQFYAIICSIMGEEEITETQYSEVYSSAYLELCEYLDDNQFYITDELRVQVFASLVDAEDYSKITDPTRKEQMKEFILNEYKQTKKIIIEESGVAEISKHFRKVSKSSPDSPIIRHIKKKKMNPI